nr:MerR family DNA-binding transcriptional regulator [Streptomyces sp. SID3343]
MSRRTGISSRSLRSYEQLGLLHPRRLPNGYRDFSEESLVCAERVRDLLRSGLGRGRVAAGEGGGGGGGGHGTRRRPGPRTGQHSEQYRHSHQAPRRHPGPLGRSTSRDGLSPPSRDRHARLALFTSSGSGSTSVDCAR